MAVELLRSDFGKFRGYAVSDQLSSSTVQLFDRALREACSWLSRRADATRDRLRRGPRERLSAGRLV